MILTKGIVVLREAIHVIVGQLCILLNKVKIYLMSVLFLPHDHAYSPVQVVYCGMMATNCTSKPECNLLHTYLSPIMVSNNSIPIVKCKM